VPGIPLRTPRLAGADLIQIDHEKRRIDIVAEAEFSGVVVCRAMARELRDEPRAASYDFVMDVRRTTTGSTLQDFQIVLEAYRQAPRTPGLKYGCFVSFEAGYQYWAASMGALFGDRTCLVFSSPEDAHAFLDSERSAPGAVA
jgi:hypothetical protein